MFLIIYLHLILVEAAYIIENSYKNFPEGSIHIIGVDSEKTIEQSHLVIN